jgi:PAS domain S-box-containing protein
LTDPNDELERLRVSESRLRAALDARAIGVWEWDVESGQGHLDERGRAVFGLTAGATPTFDGFLARVHPDDIPLINEAVARLLGSPLAEPLEATFRLRLEERVSWVSVSGRCSFDTAGRPRLCRGAVMDVTERETLREKTEARVRRQEARGRLLHRHARAANPDQSLKILCEETARALSASMVLVRVIDQATGLTSSAHEHGAPPGWAPTPAKPADRERFFEAHGPLAHFPDITSVADLPGVSHLRSHGFASLAHARLTLEDKTSGILLAAWSCRRELDDEELQYFAGMADIAAAVLVSARLAARYREIVNTMSECVVLTDSAGCITFVNPAVEAFLGYSEHELLGETGMKLWFEEDRAEREARHRALLRGAQPKREMLRYRTRDGREVWGLEATLRFRDTSIRAGALTIVTDVTESRKIDAALRQAQRLEGLGVLAGGIAHDFNNLLVGILGNATLVREDVRDRPELEHSLADIETAAVRGAELTQQLLAYAGKGRFVLAKSSVNELVEGMARLVSATISKRVTVRYDLSSSPPLVVEGDPTQLRQVVLNLLTNAADAIGDASGLVTLRTRAITLDGPALSGLMLGEGLEAGSYVAIEVEDTGAGMSEATRARIFDPFFTTKFTGRGLGLAAVLGILRAHRGAIDVQSVEGQGTTFRIYLPRVAEPAPETAAPGSSVAPTALGRTVLVVDDEDSVRRVMRRVLTRRGFEVLEAVDGPSAIETFTSHAARIAVVVLDYTMPGMSGAETLAKLREIDPDLRVVLASGYTEEDATRLVGGGGVHGFVMKPFTADSLVERVLAALEPGAALKHHSRGVDD